MTQKEINKKSKIAKSLFKKLANAKDRHILDLETQHSNRTDDLKLIVKLFRWYNDDTCVEMIVTSYSNDDVDITLKAIEKYCEEKTK